MTGTTENDNTGEDEKPKDEECAAIEHKDKVRVYQKVLEHVIEDKND